MKTRNHFFPNGQENLRGRTVRIKVKDERITCRVITHIRADRWLVEGEGLPIEKRRVGRKFVRRMCVRLSHRLEKGPGEES